MQTYKHLKVIKVFLILGIIAVCSFAQGQSGSLENWQAKLEETEGQTRINLLIQLSKDLLKEDINQAEILAKEGLELSGTIDDSISYHQLNVNLGIIYCYKNQLEKGLPFARQSLNYYDRLGFDANEKARAQFGLAMLLHEKGEEAATDSLCAASLEIYENNNNQEGVRSIYARQGFHFILRKDFPKAKENLLAALKLRKDVNYKDEFSSQILMNLGIVERNLGNFSVALEKYFQALKITKKEKLKAKCYLNISNIYLRINELDTALEYAKKSLQLKEKIGSEPMGIAVVLQRMAEIQKKKLNFGQALEYYDQCLAIKKQVQGKRAFIEETLVGIGNVYVEMGSIEEGLSYYEQSLALATENNNWEGICNANYNKGFTLYKKKNYQEALEPLMASYNLALEKESLRYIRINCAVLNNCHNELGNEDIADKFAEQYYATKDSMFSIAKIKALGVVEQKNKEDVEKDSLKQALSTYEAMEKEEMKKSFSYIGVLLLLLLIFAVFYILIKKRGLVNKSKEKDSTYLSNKLDVYFEELLKRLDNNELLANSEGQVAEEQSNDINDMTSFLVQNLNTESDWKSFERYFTRVHKDFFKQLKKAYPAISTNELNLCALLKLNVPNKEIAQIMGISYESVRKAQHRLAKKLPIPSHQVLRDFILEF